MRFPDRMDVEMQLQDFWSNQRENGIVINKDGENYVYSNIESKDQEFSLGHVHFESC